MTKRFSQLLVVPLLLVAALVLTAVPAEAAVVQHRCGNPSARHMGTRAALCGDLIVENGRVLGQAVAFCQLDSGDFREVQCAGIEMGVDLYRRSPGGQWVRLEHSANAACGRFNPGIPCWPGRNWWQTATSYPTSGPCYYYRAQARATIVLPGGNGLPVPDIRVDSSVPGQEWGTLACRA